MSITSEIQRLQTIKTDIRNALVKKGISAASSHNFADFSTDISTIKVASTGVPKFTYTGAYSLETDTEKNWKIYFTSSGTLNFSELGLGDGLIDVFLVGGGAGGCWSSAYDDWGSIHWCWGGGGYTKTATNVQVNTGTNYAVVIGAGSAGVYNYGWANASAQAGGASSFGGNFRANGAVGHQYSGGNGGSGGGGGVDGGNGSCGSGQGTTTREFGESNGKLYASGGGASSATRTANTGNGGAQHEGQSGIVVIRNHR